MRTTLERMLGVKSIDCGFGRSYGRRFRLEYNPMFLEGGLGGFKIRVPGEVPSMRLDFKQHEEKPANHLQYGREFFTGRSGNEAVDIFAEVFRLNTGIDLPRPPEMMMPKKPGPY